MKEIKANYSRSKKNNYWNCRFPSLSELTLDDIQDALDGITDY